MNDGGASNKRAKKAADKATKSATKQQVADFVANPETRGADTSKNNEDSAWVSEGPPVRSNHPIEYSYCIPSLLKGPYPTNTKLFLNLLNLKTREVKVLNFSGEE